MLPVPDPTRNLFFTGKGGVGKTSLACATALHLAEAGKRVLLVSTDPASNLDQMLGVPLGQAPTPVPGASTLWAMNIDPDRAAEDYRRRVLEPYAGQRTPDELATMREQLSGACTTEIAAFDRFAGLLGGKDLEVPFDHVVFDTAPTGHTLRLLQLPRAWTTFLGENEHGASCLGPHSGLTMRQERFETALSALVDPAHTTIVLVSRPNRSALREAARTAGELVALGVSNQRLVLNGVFHAADPHDAIAAAFEARGRDAIAELPSELRPLPRSEVPLRPYDMVGLDALRALLRDDAANDEPAPGEPPADATALELPSLESLIDTLALEGRGLVMVMGKGGVGKTTVAAAIAVELASRGVHVHLSTTDPAAHVASTVAGALPNLEVGRIDPAAETKAYVDAIMARRGPSLDARGRELLEEDLRSPCTEEVAVFHAFSRLVASSRKGVVVLDTAPTGHTLLLLDATGSYHRDVLRGMTPGVRGSVTTPLMRLRDPEATKVLLVTLPEPTPVSEATHLRDDLRRAGIEPFAWVINGCLAATPTRDPLLRRRAAAERRWIEHVRGELATRVAIVPWVPDEPVGVDRLRAFVRGRGAADR